MLAKIKAFLLLLGSNPIVAWLVRQVTTCAVVYYAADPFTPLAWQKWVVNGVVFIVAGVVHAFDVWLQNRVANGPAPAPPQQSPTPAPAGPPSHLDSLRRVLKMVVLLLGFALAASPAFCQWQVSNKPFKFTQGISFEQRFTMTPAVDGETDLVLIPTASFNANPFLGLGTPSYGYTLDEALLLARVMPSDAVHAAVSSVVGATAGFYFDLYPWMKGSGPWQCKGELGLIGPDIGTGVVPGIQKVWDFNTGEQQLLVNLNLPIGIFEDATIIKVATVPNL